MTFAMKATKACFKRRATAVLSWLDCSSTAARHQHDLVSDAEFNSIEWTGCWRKHNTKIKKAVAIWPVTGQGVKNTK